MRFRGIGGKVALAGMLMTAAPFVAGSADARPRPSGGHAYARAISASFSGSYGGGRSYGYARHTRYYGSYSGGYLQCVPFARENTGIELAGNASNWWSAAQGVYERGARPEVGSILNFRATGRMQMGHVAVVSNIVNARTVSIDHANWSGHGSVSHDTTVVDVSPNNDWTAVRVALDHTDTFGSIYPTYGFIYDRPDRGTMVANNGYAPAPVLNAAPRDLRPAEDRLVATAPQDVEEVAEAADDSDEAQPRFTRVGHRLVRVHARFHGSNGGSHHGFAHTEFSRGYGPRPAQVLRIHGTAAPVGHVQGRHRGRA